MEASIEGNNDLGEKSKIIQPRSFREIQSDLDHLKENPDPQKESQLRIERARLVIAAEDAGVFRNIRNAFDDEINIFADVDYIGTRNRLDNNIDASSLELEARALDGWSDKFEGLIDEYKKNELRNMDLAFLNTQSDLDMDGKKRGELIRDIRLFGWGTQRSGLEERALRSLKRAEKEFNDERASRQKEIEDQIKKEEEEAEAEKMKKENLELQENVRRLQTQLMTTLVALRDEQAESEKRKSSDISETLDKVARGMEDLSKRPIIINPPEVNVNVPETGKGSDSGVEIPRSPEEISILVLEAINRAEKKATEVKATSYDPARKEIWGNVEELIEAIPDRVDGEFYDTGSDLALMYRGTHPEGMGLKARLEAILVARRALSDRYVEIDQSGGDLQGMKAGNPELKTISNKVTEVAPEHWWTIIHNDEMLPELQNHIRYILFPDRNYGDLIVNVDSSLSAWLEVGLNSDRLPENMLTDDEKDFLEYVFTKYNDNLSSNKRKAEIGANWPPALEIYQKLLEAKVSNAEDLVYRYIDLPTYKNSLNSEAKEIELKRRIAGSREVGSTKAEDLAYKLLRISFVVDGFDRERDSNQGKGEPRDLLFSEFTRMQNFAAKEREPGLDWTIGRSVAREDQEGMVKIEKGKEHSKLLRRKWIMKRNSEDPVFRGEKDPYIVGELVGPLLYQTILVPDVLNPGGAIARKIISYVIGRDGTKVNEGWKNIPFLKRNVDGFGKEWYSGYFGYTLGIGGAVVESHQKQMWKEPKEMFNSTWWSNIRQLQERLKIMCPYTNDYEYRMRGKVLRDIWASKSGGTKYSRLTQETLSKISGISDLESELSMIEDPAQRNLLRDFILENQGEIVQSAKEGRKFVGTKYREMGSDEYVKKVMSELRLNIALGQIWPGSLDALSGISVPFDTSSGIKPNEMNKIYSAMSNARFLDDEEKRKFLSEIGEMGFGLKKAYGLKQAIRNERTKESKK